MERRDERNHPGGRLSPVAPRAMSADAPEMDPQMAKRIAKWLGVALLIVVAGLSSLLGACRYQASRRETRPRVAAAPATGRFVRAGDVDVFIQEVGPEDAPVVLFVHGMGAWSELWRETLAATAAAGFRAVALDLPPFGYSERPARPAYSRQDQARRIIGVIDALGQRQVTLVGHSFGGGPTMEAVLLAPERMKTLVLADAAIGLDSPAGSGGVATHVLGIRPLRNAIVSATVTNPRLTRSLLSRFVEKQDAITDQRLAVLQAPLAVQGDTEAFGDWLIEFVTSQEAPLSKQPEAYRAVRLPALIIWGDKDTTTPLAQGQRLSQLISGSELAVMPGIGHMPQIEDAGQFNRLLVTFLKNVSAPPRGGT
jgi:pimeloyl-ACP methyl ester carboxylesterase